MVGSHLTGQHLDRLDPLRFARSIPKCHIIHGLIPSLIEVEKLIRNLNIKPRQYSSHLDGVHHQPLAVITMFDWNIRIFRNLSKIELKIIPNNLKRNNPITVTDGDHDRPHFDLIVWPKRAMQHGTAVSTFDPF